MPPEWLGGTFAGAGFVLVIVVAFWLFGRWRPIPPRSQIQDVLDATRALEVRFQKEQSKREQAEWERDELKRDLSDMRKDRERWIAWEQKANDYDALETLFEETKAEFDRQLDAMANRAQQAQSRLDLVKRDIPDAKTYLAGIDTQIAQTKAPRTQPETPENRNPAGSTGD